MITIPEIAYFSELLNGSFGIEWKYLSHNAKYLTAPGENYGSTMLALDVVYENNKNEKKLNLVAKLCPPTELLKSAFQTEFTFKKEANFYLHAYPTLRKFEIDYNIPESKQLDVFAKCYGARLNLNNNDQVDSNAVIVLDNLKTQGYVCEDRMQGFDLTTTKEILKILARVHAEVIAMRILNPSEFQKKVLPCLETVNNGGVMVDGFIDAAISMAKQIPECQPHWENLKSALEKRKKFKGLLFPVKTNKNFYSMIHTDFWTNNIMILKNGSSLKIKIIDFQLLDYGSCIRDLIFFLYSSVQIEVFDEYFDDLLKLYHNSFTERLEDFKCDTNDFSWNLFMEEVNDVAPHEFFHIIFMLKPIFCERGTVADLNGIKIADFGRTDNLGKNYLQKLKQIVLSYVHRNWLQS